MGKLLYLFGSVSVMGLSLIVFASSADSQQQPTGIPQQTQTSSDSQSQKPVHKVHVKKGGRDDINAIGKRKIVDKDFYSLDQEIKQGNEEARRVEEKIKLLDDPVINEYINRIGQNLVRNSDTQVPVEIKVVDSAEINAFSVAGGHLYVNSGMVLDCQNEAELAGVMSHAIAHLAARHASRLWTREQILARMESPKLTVISDPRSDGALLFPLGLMKFHRTFEMEADYFGIQYIYKAGYDPMAFVQRLERNDKYHIKPGSLEATFSNEPLPAERIAAAKKEIARILPPNDHLAVNTPEFDSIKARLAERKNRQPEGNQSAK